MSGTWQAGALIITQFGRISSCIIKYSVWNTVGTKNKWLEYKVALSLAEHLTIIPFLDAAKDLGHYESLTAWC